MNRIAVTGDEALLSSQTRTYAEYRIFSVVARHTRRVQRVRVVLTPVHGDAECARLKCAVTVDLDGAPALRIRATGRHIYEAINRAVERLGAAMDRQVEERRSS
jgi:ribosome-associated translation inhibitor RaiA